MTLIPRRANLIGQGNGDIAFPTRVERKVRDHLGDLAWFDAVVECELCSRDISTVCVRAISMGGIRQSACGRVQTDLAFSTSPRRRSWGISFKGGGNTSKRGGHRRIVSDDIIAYLWDRLGYDLLLQRSREH